MTWLKLLPKLYTHVICHLISKWDFQSPLFWKNLSPKFWVWLLSPCCSIRLTLRFIGTKEPNSTFEKQPYIQMQMFSHTFDRSAKYWSFSNAVMALYDDYNDNNECLFMYSRLFVHSANFLFLCCIIFSVYTALSNYWCSQEVSRSLVY